MKNILTIVLSFCLVLSTTHAQRAFTEKLPKPIKAEQEPRTKKLQNSNFKKFNIQKKDPNTNNGLTSSKDVKKTTKKARPARLPLKQRKIREVSGTKLRKPNKNKTTTNIQSGARLSGTLLRKPKILHAKDPNAKRKWEKNFSRANKNGPRNKKPGPIRSKKLAENKKPENHNKWIRGFITENRPKKLNKDAITNKESLFLMGPKAKSITNKKERKKLYLEGKKRNGTYKAKNQKQSQTPNKKRRFDDHYEPNDYFNEAHRISTQNNFYQAYQWNDDYYYVEVPLGANSLVVDVRFFDDEGDIDLEIYDQNENLVDSSSSSTDDEYLDVNVNPGEIYYVRIHYGDAGNPYDLSFYTYCYSSCEPLDDFYEPNNYISEAWDLSNYEDAWITGYQLDDDYYEIYIDSEHRDLDIDLQFNHRNGDIDLQLLDEFNTIIASSTSGSDDEYISLTDLNPGTYFIRVFYGDTGNEYDLKWQSFFTGPEDDFYEPNNDRFDAYDLVDWEGNWLCDHSNACGYQYNDDWFEIEVSEGYQQVLVDLRFTDSLGDIDVRLMNSYGSIVASSTGTSDDEFIQVIVDQPGTYYIRVYGNDNGNEYDLMWWTLEGGEDYYEPNDYRSTAFDLVDREGIWLCTLEGCGAQFDDDYYLIEVLPFYQNLVVQLEFEDDLGNIDLAIYDSSGNRVAYSTGHGNSELIDIVLEEPGFYYIKVYNENKGNYYDLVWNTYEGGAHFLEDNYEPNDYRSSATNLINWEGNWLCDLDGCGAQFDPDYYEIYVEPSYQRVLIDLQFNDDWGDIDLELQNQHGNRVASSRGNSDREFIDFTVSEAGTYYIKVYHDNEGNPYDLQWWTEAGGFTEDFYEENDTREQSYNLANQKGIWLSNIEGLGTQADSDYYKIEVSGDYRRIMIDLRHFYREGNVDLELLSFDGSLQAASRTNSDDEYIDYTVRTPGTYYIRVTGDNIGSQYDLSWVSDLDPNIPACNQTYSCVVENIYYDFLGYTPSTSSEEYWVRQFCYETKYSILAKELATKDNHRNFVINAIVAMSNNHYRVHIQSPEYNLPTVAEVNYYTASMLEILDNGGSETDAKLSIITELMDSPLWQESVSPDLSNRMFPQFAIQQILGIKQAFVSTNHTWFIPLRDGLITRPQVLLNLLEKRFAKPKYAKLNYLMNSWMAMQQSTDDSAEMDKEWFNSYARKIQLSTVSLSEILDGLFASSLYTNYMNSKSCPLSNDNL